MSLQLRTAVTSLVVAGAFALAPAPAEAASGQGNDQPDALAQARDSQPIRGREWVPGALSTRADRDWFRFRVRSRTTALITLGGLPADYRLALYARGGRRIAVSDRTGRAFEQLAPILDPGDYFVEVSASRGAVDPRAAYRVQVRRLPRRLQVLDSHRVADEALLVVTGQLLNNSRWWRQYPKVTARFFDRTGRYVGSSTALAEQTTLAPGDRGAFRVVAPALADAVRYELCVSSGWLATPERARPVVAPDVPYALAGGRVRHVGRVLTPGGDAAGPVHVHVLRYDADGALLDFGHAVLPEVTGAMPGRYEVDLPANGAVRATRVTVS